MSNLNDILSSAARRLEVELGGNAEELKALGFSLSTDLAQAFGQEGYEEALVASRDIVALHVGINAAEIGDAADGELRGVIFGFLATAAGAA